MFANQNPYTMAWTRDLVLQILQRPRALFMTRLAEGIYSRL